MSKLLAIGAGVLAVIAGVLFWRLTAAHEALGEANLKADLNAAAVGLLQSQEQFNQRLDARLEALSRARAVETREIIREVHRAPSSDACRHSPAMRALDGRLRWQPRDADGRPAAAATPVEPVRAPGR